jgi:hypothetical protein
MKNLINTYLEENYPDYEILLAAGLEEAFIGVSESFGNPKACYDYRQCVDIIMTGECHDGEPMSFEEAEEWMQTNVVNAYVGEFTPTFLYRFNKQEFVDDNDYLG